MHKKLITILLLVYSFPYITVSQTNKYVKMNFGTTEKKSEFILYLAKNYCSDAKAILDYTEKPKQYTKWASSSTHRGMLIEYATVIHETCHGANFKIGGFSDTINQQGIFVSKDIQIRVPETKHYRTDELDKTITKEQKDEIFRLRTYVLNQNDNGKKNILPLSSVNEGIFGLMNEFAAYYHGTKAGLEIYKYYKVVYADNDDDIIEVFRQISSEVYAYYEFRLFIAWYLKYAKTHHKDVYNQCINNNNLKVAFTFIDRYYANVVNDYFVVRQQVIDNINAKVKDKASISEGAIKIQNGNSSTSYYGPDKDIAYLKSQFTDEDYEMLALLTINELTPANYKDYLIR